MPVTRVVFYKDSEGSQAVDWLEWLKEESRQASYKCHSRLLQLSESGFDLRRPAADLLRDGIYELRWRSGKVQYRILYFFGGRNLAVISHGFIKYGGPVEEKEIQKAIANKARFILNPRLHSYEKAF